MQESEERSVIVKPTGRQVAATEVPAILTAAGAAGSFAWEEFFLGKIRNPHTRVAYLHAVRRFLAWCDTQHIIITGITPGMVGRYFDDHPGSIPSKKLHLAAIRSFFDVLVQRHVMVLNPAHSVRTERYSAIEGKTPEITTTQARQLLASITLDKPVDFRDRAIIGLLIYTAARAGAIAKLRVRDFVDEANQFTLRFAEKGGKSRSIPVRHDLQLFLQDYLAVAGINGEAKDTPLLRTAVGRAGNLTSSFVTGVDICRMVKRRLKMAGLPTIISPHSFRSCAATDLLMQGVPLEDVQHLLGHSDSRVTKLYDRRQRRVTRNVVERISV